MRRPLLLTSFLLLGGLAPAVAQTPTPAESARAMLRQYQEDPARIDRARDLLEAHVARGGAADLPTLRRLRDGRVRVELKRAWRDGTTHLLFEPLELLEKLAAVTPRPQLNLVLYHGVLAPHARWRPDVVAYQRARSTRAADPNAITTGAGAGAEPARDKPRYWTWAALMRRAFDIDVLR